MEAKTKGIEHSSERKIRSHFSLDAWEGLNEDPKKISAKYLYDARGSQLFVDITDQDEYYLTQAELEIFSTHRQHFFSDCLGPEFDLIEFGAGDGKKTKVLIEYFILEGKKFNYYPIDISTSALTGLVDQISQEWPNLGCFGINKDYFDYLRERSSCSTRQKVVLFTGSTIGNYQISERNEFFKNLHGSLNKNDIALIGFDLVKDVSLLNKAYNDRKGVTAQFNYNLLLRMNRELNTNFEVDQFYHYGFYNPLLRSMESYLISKKLQEVQFPDFNSSIWFGREDPVHIEYSQKFTEQMIDQFASDHNFVKIRNFSDQNSYFINSVWRVD